jgi:hypothetical protein
VIYAAACSGLGALEQRLAAGATAAAAGGSGSSGGGSSSSGESSSSGSSSSSSSGGSSSSSSGSSGSGGSSGSSGGSSGSSGSSGGSGGSSAAVQLIGGGLAGMLAWLSVYPLDVGERLPWGERVEDGPRSGQVAPSRQGAAKGCCWMANKTFTPPTPAPRPTPRTAPVKSRLQAQPAGASRYAGAWECAAASAREEGVGVFTRGLWPTLSRAFLVNAAIFASFEAATAAMDERARRRRSGGGEGGKGG